MLRKQMILGLGRELSRRSKSRCELCTKSSSLQVFEVPPLPEEPSLEKSLFVCHICHQRLEGILTQSKKTNRS